MRGNVIIDVLAAVMLAVAVDILADMEIAVVTAGVITLEFIFKVAHTVEILAGVCSAPGINTNVITSGSATVTTASEFALPAPSEKPFLPF